MDREDIEQHVREQVDERFNQYNTYTGYVDLCDKHEVVPVTRESLIDKYVNILMNQPSIKERAEVHLISDKEIIIAMMEKMKSSAEDILEVDNLFPTDYVVINKLKEGVICLVVLFMEDNLIIAPAYFGADNKEVEFPEELNM